jgi:hypothetical protein
MNKFAFIILFMAALVSSSSLKVASQVITEPDHIFDSEITVSLEIENISQEDIDSIKKEILVALNFIPQILGVEHKNETKIKIVDQEICYLDRGVVILSISHIKERSAPIIHELTHTLTNHLHNSFFTEGLAVYFQERFGKTNSFPNYSENLDDLIREHEEQLLNLSQLMNDNEIFGSLGTTLRRIAYIEAGSFIKFLVEKYGEQKLGALNNSNTLDYEKIYGKELNELEEEWKNYVLVVNLSKL